MGRPSPPSPGPGPGPRSCTCGRTVEAGHRFCPSCAAPVDSTLASGGDDPGVDLLLQGRSRNLHAGGEVRTGVSPIVAVGGVLAVLVLAWALFRRPSSEPPPDPPADESAQTDGDDRDGDETTTTRPRRSTTTAPRDDPDDEDAATGDGAPPGPLLGEATGLVLVSGSIDGGKISLLDLDTGEAGQIDDVSGSPLGVVGSRLVVQGSGGELSLIDVAETDRSTDRAIESSSGGWVEFVGVRDDLVWVLESSDPTEELALASFDGQGERRLAIDMADVPLGFFGFARSLTAGPIQNVAGGVYQWDGDGFRLRADGQLRAVGERLALVHRCDEALRCGSVWYDTDSWTEVELPPAPPFANQRTVQMLTDRWLVEFDWTENRAVLWEIATGEIARDMAHRSRYGPFGPAVAVSGDGRWLMDGSEGTAPVVVDLESGEEFPVEVSVSSTRVALFVSITGAGAPG